MSRVILHHRGMRGLGQAPAVCLDQSQNQIDCADPNCTYGDCGATGPQVTVGSLCLDQSQNQIDCADPNCTYGDCISATGKKSTVRTAPISAAALVAAPATQVLSRPSPVVSVPLSTSSVGMFLENATLLAGIPNWAVIVGVPVIFSLLFGSGFGAGRYKVSRRK